MKACWPFNMPYIVYWAKTIAGQQQSIRHYPFHVAILEDSIITDKMTLLFLLPWLRSGKKADGFDSIQIAIWIKPRVFCVVWLPCTHRGRAKTLPSMNQWTHQEGEINASSMFEIYNFTYVTAYRCRYTYVLAVIIGLTLEITEHYWIWGKLAKN